MATIRIGTAGWNLAKDSRDAFPGDGDQLQRYAQVLGAVEINRTFKKLPMARTLRSWRDKVPEDFRFCLKMPEKITHDRRLDRIEEPLEEFLNLAGELGDRLGAVLIQLPPSLEFDTDRVRGFAATLRQCHDGPVALEARHESWFGEDAERLLKRNDMARVAADPPQSDADGWPLPAKGFAYFRLHGQPKTYYSAYREEGGLDDWARRIRKTAEDVDDVWCIFDNTAAGAGTGDAVELQKRLER